MAPIPRSLDQEVERWPRRRRQRAAGGSGDERKLLYDLDSYFLPPSLSALQ